jgi:DNA helicase-2/ATP-dependent DNA helicase PcrA
MFSLDDLLKTIGKEDKFNEEQREIIENTEGPLWVIAGPGSGKTETLVIRTLNLIFLKKVPPRSIFITTFTEKAAKELLSRISYYSNLIKAKHPELKSINPVELRVGTLHSLANDILQEYKYPHYEHVRLIDDIEQKLFISSFSIAVREIKKFESFWQKFNFSKNTTHPIPSITYIPSILSTVFNYMTENLVDIQKIKEEDDEALKQLIEIYEDYIKNLEKFRRCDFSYLQKIFLEFLQSPDSELFRKGDGKLHSGIKYIMVDEYQDTNPIQEKIYFTLAKDSGNICVVGDDDQALYRFRGATVNSIVNFDKACEFYLKRSVKKIFLVKNYRSTKDIIDFYNEYILSIDEMKKEGVRVKDKPKVKFSREQNIDIPVFYIEGDNVEDVADKVAEFINYLKESSIINDYSDCVILMPSTKEDKNNALPFVEALKKRNISVYNPRSKNFTDNEEIKGLLGALIKIIDPNLENLNNGIKIKRIKEKVKNWVETYEKIKTTELNDYVIKSIQEISKKQKKQVLGVNILDIFYRLLALPPFKNYKEDEEKTYRIGKLTQILEAFSSIPYSNYNFHLTKGDLRIDKDIDGKLDRNWVKDIYLSLITLLSTENLDNPENEDFIVPKGKLPFMTVHQSKGLEFPVVFVYKLKEPILEDRVSKLEKIFKRYIDYPYETIEFSTEEKVIHDKVRRYFVAFSRARDLLVLIIPKDHKKHEKEKDELLGFINKSFEETVKIIKRLEK